MNRKSSVLQSFWVLQLHSAFFVIQMRLEGRSLLSILEPEEDRDGKVIFPEVKEGLPKEE
tara:strand:- start:2 stop:181 length:180 start_codon:yes stop_codon:yes gene_type:complete